MKITMVAVRNLDMYLVKSQRLIWELAIIFGQHQKPEIRLIMLLPNNKTSIVHVQYINFPYRDKSRDLQKFTSMRKMQILIFCRLKSRDHIAICLIS